MKKFSMVLGFICFLFIPLSAFAREEVQPLIPNPVENRVEGPGLDFEFAFAPGKLSEAQTGKIFSTGTHSSDFALPSLKEKPVPIRYPRWAVREGWEGTFVIAVEVLTNGEVGRWYVIQSTGYRLLDEAATEAVRQWHFHPATEKSRAILACIQIPIHFQLQD